MKSGPVPSVWEQWRIRQRQKRSLISWGFSAGLSLIALGLLLWGGLPILMTVGEKGQTLAVKLGNPEGEDLPLSVSAVPDPSMQAVLEAQRHSVQNTVEETRAVPPDSGPAPLAAAPRKPLPPQADSTKAAPAAPPAAKPQPTQTPPVAAKPADVPVVTEKVIRGVERGNSSELVLKPQGEKISQNAYWPVYLFMPLPARLDAGLLAKVQATNLYSADERKSRLLQFYKKTPEGLVLSTDPGLPVRPALWEIIEGAGYDVSNADYKQGKDLKPVVISFQLGVPKTSTDNPALSQVQLEQSSGSAPVDAAVLYAFQKSTFANGTGQVAQGRYTYDFTDKK
jgi:hypothetical protein